MLMLFFIRFAVMQCKTISLQFYSDRVHAAAARAATSVLMSDEARARGAASLAVAKSANLLNRLDLDINEESDDLLHMWIHPLTEKYRALTLMHFFPPSQADDVAERIHGTESFPSMDTQDNVAFKLASTEISVRIHSMAKIFARFEYASAQPAVPEPYAQARGTSSFHPPRPARGSRSNNWSSHGIRRRSDASDNADGTTTDEMQYVYGDQTTMLGHWLSLEVEAPSKTFLQNHRNNILFRRPAYRVEETRGHERPSGVSETRTSNLGTGSSEPIAPVDDDKDRRHAEFPTLDVVFPSSRLILSNMPLSKTLQMSSLRLRLETARSSTEDGDESASTQQNLEFFVTSTKIRLLDTHLQWLLTTVSNWSTLLEDHRLRNVFNFERTVWNIQGNFVCNVNRTLSCQVELMSCTLLTFAHQVILNQRTFS